GPIRPIVGERYRLALRFTRKDRDPPYMYSFIACRGNVCAIRGPIKGTHPGCMAAVLANKIACAASMDEDGCVIASRGNVLSIGRAGQGFHRSSMSLIDTIGISGGPLPYPHHC